MAERCRSTKMIDAPVLGEGRLNVSGPDDYHPRRQSLPALPNQVWRSWR
jgi:hypothetical protein